MLPFGLQGSLASKCPDRRQRFTPLVALQGKAIRYTIPTTARTQLDLWNRDIIGRQRYNAILGRSDFLMRLLSNRSGSPSGVLLDFRQA